MGDDVQTFDLQGNVSGVMGTTPVSASYSGTITIDYTTQAASGELSYASPLNTNSYSTFFVLPRVAESGVYYTIEAGGSILTGQAQLDKDPGIEVVVPYADAPDVEIEVYDGSTLYSGNQVVCFTTGTRIMTTKGYVAVEDLKAGTDLLTLSGRVRPICWLGHRAVECGRHPRPFEVLPVRIAAHAFGANRPSRDLLVSPGHAICVDIFGETLIPAASLINGTTITQMSVARVTYWHVELESHDIIFAENLPCESYLEMGNRGFFAESGFVALAATPDAPMPTQANFCHPFQAAGPLVEAVRAQLAARAETTVAA